MPPPPLPLHCLPPPESWLHSCWQPPTGQSVSPYDSKQDTNHTANTSATKGDLIGSTYDMVVCTPNQGHINAEETDTISHVWMSLPGHQR